MELCFELKHSQEIYYQNRTYFVMKFIHDTSGNLEDSFLAHNILTKLMKLPYTAFQVFRPKELRFLLDHELYKMNV